MISPPLDPSVHFELERYLERNFESSEIAFRVYDTVEAQERYQVRTVIIRLAPNPSRDGAYRCIQSSVDYTRHIHEEGGESDLMWFDLPTDAIKRLAIDHMEIIESDNRTYRWNAAPEPDWRDDIEIEFEEEIETLDKETEDPQAVE